jgi:hypothetical protein
MVSKLPLFHFCSLHLFEIFPLDPDIWFVYLEFVKVVLGL